MLTVGSLSTVVDDGFSQALCPRGISARTLVNRMTVRCLVNKVQAFLRLVQEGGDAQNFQFINPADFPEAKNELLIESFDQTRDFVDNLYLGPDTQQEVRDNLHQWANWMGFGDAAGNIALSMARWCSLLLSSSRKRRRMMKRTTRIRNAQAVIT